MNILDAFAAQVKANPERLAIVDGRGRATSFAALDARAAALADAWTRAGLRPGDRVLMAPRLDADLYASLAALWRLGAVAVLPEPALGLFGLRHAVAATQPRAFLAAGIFRLLPALSPALRRIPLRLRLAGGTQDETRALDLPAEMPALISFTSGSTGAPKAIVRTHAFLHAQAEALRPVLDSAANEIDLVAFPVVVVANLGRGTTSVLPNWRLSRPLAADPREVVAHAERHRVTRLALSPALAETVAARPPTSVHTLFVGGGPVFPDLLDRLAAAAPGLRLVCIYGSTEAEPIAHCEWGALDPADRDVVRNGGGLLAGAVATGVRVRLVDDEILVAGPHVVQGYLDPADDATTKTRDADGTTWHRTGDAGWRDAQGRLWLLGRCAGRAGGLWPFPVEAAARRWPGVARAALIGVEGVPTLAIEGDARNATQWRAWFAAMGGGDVRHVRRMPMDRRHGSKIDMVALGRLL